MHNNKLNYTPRVLQVLPRLNAGGVERGTLEIAKSLKNHGFEPFVCSGGGKMVKDLENLGAYHIKLPVYSKNPFTIITNIFRLQNIITKYQINIVHARSRAPAWSCYFACKLSKVKFITTFHGTYKISNVFKRYYNSIMLKGDKVIAVSKFIYNHIIKNYKVDNKKIEIIHRGVDLDYFFPEKVDAQRISKLKQYLLINDKTLKDKKIIIMPARFTRWKGHLYLLDMLQTLSKVEFLCLLTGANEVKHQDYLQEIKSKILNYNLQDKVLLKHEVKDMPALYMLSDFVISTSLKPEAFGRTITEGQSMKKVVICTNKGGAAEESIIDKVTGFHIPSDNINQASNILRTVLQINGNEYNEIALNAYNMVKDNFSLEKMCDQTIKIYNSLTSSCV